MNPPRLLLVDDAPDIALIVQRFGRRAGHAVVALSGAESAWDYLQHERPDLVVLDLNLPGQSGADLCRRLRTLPELAELRVALFSHWERPLDIITGLDAGANFVLSKDLLCQPDAWQMRLAEILPPAPGRAPPLSLAWWDTTRQPGSRLARLVTQGLFLAAHQALGEQMVRCLVRRAGRLAQVPDGWLAPDGLGLDVERAMLGPPEVVRAFAVACAEQLWCLLGTAASAPFRALLEAETPSCP